MYLEEEKLMLLGWVVIQAQSAKLEVEILGVDKMTNELTTEEERTKSM